MTIDVSEDLDEAGGYAFIDLGRHIDIPFAKISIRRLDAEPRHLGVEDWQPEVAWLEPRSVERRTQSTVIRVGPEIVDRIEELVRIEIVAEADRSLGIVTWPAIAPSPGVHGSLSLQGATRPPPPLVADDLSVKTTAAPEPTALAPEPAVEMQSPGPTVSATEAVVMPPGRRKPLWAAAAVLVLGVAGAAFWTFYQQAPAAPQPRATGPAVSAGELTHRLEALLQHTAASAALIAIGSEALAAGHTAVAFRAFEAADPYASPEAALQLARIYDPRNADEGHRAATPNVPRAITYYALWKNRSASHTAELKALCSASAGLVAGNDRLTAACRD